MLQVVAAVSDKASPNQKFIRMHKLDEGLTYKTKNLLSPDRDILFISDPPHLLKTLRNNLSSSTTGGTKYLWVSKFCCHYSFQNHEDLKINRTLINIVELKFKN